MWVSGIVDEHYHYKAQVFEMPSKYGINEGRVSKLEVTDKNEELIISYNRSWDIEPNNQSELIILDKILGLYD